jgi:hypothetical protein
MTPLQKRFKNVIERMGDTCTVNSVASAAMFAPISPSSVKTYLEDAVFNTISARPIYLGYVGYSVAASPAQTVVWRGVNYTIKKVFELRARDQTIAKMLVLA